MLRVIKILMMALALLVVSVHQDADASSDTQPAGRLAAISILNPAIFDPTLKGVPSLLYVDPYKNEFALIAPLMGSAAPLPWLGNLPAAKSWTWAPAGRTPEKAAPEVAQPKTVAPVVKLHTASTPEVVPVMPKPAPAEAYAVPQVEAPLVQPPELLPELLTELPPRRPPNAGRGLVPSSDLGRIEFATETLAPIGHTLFCLRYPEDCRVQRSMLGSGPIMLTAARQAELVHVNAQVNHAILPRHMHESVADEQWLISPKFGDCNDYAVTKRHDLLALGWPSRDLLLAEVVTSWGVHHLVLVVRTNKGDLVADSLNKKILNWAKTPYRWVRVETPANPKFWATIKTPRPDLVAMAGSDR